MLFLTLLMIFRKGRSVLFRNGKTIIALVDVQEVFLLRTLNTP